MNIDGVFSGGGIKGYALIGAIQAIEMRGISFTRVAGTSAGAILAAFVAVGYTGKEIAEIMEEIDLQKFLDSTVSFIPFGMAKWMKIYWRMGLYKGQVLEKWLDEKFLSKGVRVFGDLPNGSLRFVASDLTNSRILVLPNDLPKYGYDIERFPIAKAVRMSAGLPFIFEPIKMGKPKATYIIIDGGVLSNFPLWLFEQTRTEKKRPILGIQLSPSLENKPPNQIKNSIELFKALFETMMDAHDQRYISRSIEKNIIFIPVENIATRDFNIVKEKKVELIQIGYNRAEQFLKNWSY